MPSLVLTICLSVLALGFAMLDDGPLATLALAIGGLALVAIGMRRLAYAAERFARESSAPRTPD